MNIHYINECLAFGMRIVDKIRNFVSFYRPPNQFEDDFENFCANFELTLDAILATNLFFNCCYCCCCYFKARSNNWYTGDTTAFEGSDIKVIASRFGLQQIISRPTHVQGV